MAPAGSDPAAGAPGTSPHPAGRCCGETGVGLEKLRDLLWLGSSLCCSRFESRLLVNPFLKSFPVSAVTVVAAGAGSSYSYLVLRPGRIPEEVALGGIPAGKE